jgi:nucleoside-diphosphate-sugar epimerase
MIMMPSDIWTARVMLAYLLFLGLTMGITIAPSKVLITGANGYIAMWVIDFLLKAGYAVRGAVRGLGKTKDLNDKFSSFVASGKLEFVVVEDITTVSNTSDFLWGN